MTTPDDTTPIVEWVCTCCGFIYEPEMGDPENGIPAGTPFDKLPENWQCPLCMALKKAFEPV